MALTEIQLPPKTEFYANVSSVASEIKRSMLRWRALSEFIADVDTGDLDAMGVPAGNIRLDLQDFRTTIDEILSFFEGNAVTPSKNPEQVMDKVRRMLVI